MPKLSMSWTENAELPAIGGRYDRPNWDDVQHRLDRAQQLCGTVTLDIEDAPEIGPKMLQVFCDRNGCVIMLGEMVLEEDGPDWNVRSFFNANADPGMIDILGNNWDARTICHDFAIVLAAFQEFFETGDVSREMLD
jgi:hypothetical protein